MQGLGSHSFVSLSQLSPSNPAAHRHSYWSGPVLLHVAPFSHGVLCPQRSRSVEQRIDNLHAMADTLLTYQWCSYLQCTQHCRCNCLSHCSSHLLELSMPRTLEFEEGHNITFFKFQCSWQVGSTKYVLEYTENNASLISRPSHANPVFDRWLLPPYSYCKWSNGLRWEWLGNEDAIM